jgi:hypothetical protein
MGRRSSVWLLPLLVAVQISYVSCVTSEQAKRRVVRGPTPGGVLLAPDLQSLNALLAARDKLPENLIPIPNGTKGRAVERKFLRSGALVEPYAANSYDMERDSVTEVNLFEVTEGPFRGSRGWVRAAYLRPDFPYL